MLEEKLIGFIDVDAGCILICDPCYIYGENNEIGNEKFPKSWDEFCKKHFKEYKNYKKIKYKNGKDGIGIIISSGYGDGTYPVYAKINKFGRIMSVRIEFNDAEEEEV